MWHTSRLELGSAFGQLALSVSAGFSERQSLPQAAQAAASLSRLAARAVFTGRVYTGRILAAYRPYTGRIQAVYRLPCTGRILARPYTGLVSRHRPATDVEFSLSAERQLDLEEEENRFGLVTATDDGEETMQRNWPKPFGNW